MRSLRRAHLPGRAIQSIAWAMGLLLVVGGLIAPGTSVFAVEPPNALTDLLREGKTPQGMYATLKKEQCLTPAAVQNPDGVIALIKKTEEAYKARPPMSGASVALLIAYALLDASYLNDRARTLLATNTYRGGSSVPAAPSLPLGRFGWITFARGVSSDNDPVSPSTEFPARINKVYAVFEVENLQPADVVLGVWYRGTERIGEQKLPAADILRTVKRSFIWIALQSDAGLTPGSYRLELSLNA